MTHERSLLTQLLKSWAQDHHTGYTIAAPEEGDEGVQNTGGFLSWVVGERYANIDLLALLDRLELFANSIKTKKPPDGMFFKSCQGWQQFAEPNQSD